MQRFLFLVLFLSLGLSTALKSQNIMDAVLKKDTLLVLSLIKKGASPNHVDPFGTTPLMSACRWGDADMTKVLLKNGATADEPRSPKGRTALMVTCAYYGGYTIARLLIENGADPNAAAADGTTALMLAAMNAKTDVVDYLIFKGANPLARNEKGETALDYANRADLTAKDAMKDTKIDKDAVIARLKNYQR